MIRKTKIFANNSRGASVLEVLLSMAIIAVAAPFVYSQISRTNQTIRDIAIARQITNTRDGVLNFIRMNQDQWPDVAQIRLTGDELAGISDIAVAGFIDKYETRGATTTDIYLAFDLDTDDLRVKKIAGHIGGDAAVVSDDGIAYGNTWAVAAPDFEAGDLIYRISRDIVGADTSKYLHRGTSGEDGLNVMGRDLNMGGYNVYNVATAMAQSARITNANATFVESADASAGTVYFSSGANIDGEDVFMDSVRVTGDVSGFRNITANNLNGHGYTTKGHIIADRATITEKINVSHDLILKSSSTKTISGFTGITVNSVLTPFVSTDEIIFYDNFGLTISGELLMSTTSPLKIGSWVFPSTKPPQFSEFTLSRAARPAATNKSEFGPLMTSSWKTIVSATVAQ